MKRHLFPVLILLTSLFMFHCKSTSDNGGGSATPLTHSQGWKWENRPALEEGGKDYILTLKADGSLGLKLDVNTCFGSYKLTDGDGISFEKGMGCTEMCCDKDGWLDFTKNIENATAYKIKGQKLTLSGGKSELVFSAVNE